MSSRPLNEVTVREIDWLWPAHLAAGKPVMIDGDPGFGKSLITLDLVARLTTGRPWPDGTPGGQPCNALILCAEDNDEDTIVPRLKALGADQARAFVWESGKPLPRLPSDIRQLDEEIKRRAARLVILDPILNMVDASVTLGGHDGIRRLMEALAQVSAKHRAALAMVRHLAKRGGGPAVYRGAGAIGFSAACRLGWLVARDPEDASRCVLAQFKNNLAPLQPSLAYTVILPPGGLPRLDWLGTAAFTADELARRAYASPDRARARDLLTELLKDGPRLSREIWSAVRGAGLSKRTVERASKELGIKCPRVPHRGRMLTFWLLPGQRLPSQFRPTEELNLDPWLKPFEDDPAGTKEAPAA